MGKGAWRKIVVDQRVYRWQFGPGKALAAGYWGTPRRCTFVARREEGGGRLVLEFQVWCGALTESEPLLYEPGHAAAIIRHMVASGWDGEGGNHHVDGLGVLEQLGHDISGLYVAVDSDLHIAADAGDLRACRAALESGIAVDLVGYADLTPLHRAAGSGHIAVMELLLDRGAPINAGFSTDPDTESDYTPLHQAARFGQTAAVELLLDRGAELAPTTRAGATPLALAQNAGRDDVAALLMGRGAKR